MQITKPFVLLSIVIVQIALNHGYSQAVKSVITKPKNSETETETKIINSRVSFNVGSVLLNPYRLGTSNVLEKSDSKAAFFIEFTLNDLWAWNPERREEFKGHSDKNWIWDDEWKLNNRLDWQTRLAYYARSGKPTNEVASALVGSGDFGGELTVTLNLFQIVHGNASKSDVKFSDQKGEEFFKSTTSAHSFGIVASYGGITDKEAFDIHSRYLVGIGYRANFRETLFSTQIGFARVDNVEFVDNSSRVIRMTNGDVPRYRSQSSMAIESELYWPLGSGVAIYAGAKLYPLQSGSSPNQWSGFIGVTYSLDKLKALLPTSY